MPVLAPALRDRYQAPGLAGCAACLAGAAFAPGFWSLTALLLGAGLAGGSVQSGSGRAVMRWFAVRERGLALGVRQTAVPVGGVVAALVLPQLGGPRAGFLAGALRIGVGHWSDTVRSRFGPFRLIGAAIAATLALVAAVAAAGGWILVPALVVATALSMAWNGVAFTIAAELGGRRSGAAIGFQQTALSAAGVVIPVAFAAAVAATSWRTSFGVAAVFPLAGWLLLRRSAE